ncbi:Uncharacterized protein Fot_53530 [Forsythia ovata]|uniref:Uncharacterized protein n=1 Tax=Forsythia ovata TaxID=205694 RepID=A0ABD1PJS7_9LAMI
MAYSRRKWWYQCARIYSARGLPTASVLTPTASHRRRLRANGGILCARKGHREEKRERERAAHSEEPTPNRDCESPAAAAARRKWWEVQREEGPPRPTASLGSSQRGRSSPTALLRSASVCLWRSAAVDLAFTGVSGGVGDF